MHAVYDIIIYLFHCTLVGSALERVCVPLGCVLSTGLAGQRGSRDRVCHSAFNHVLPAVCLARESGTRLGVIIFTDRVAMGS